MCSLAFFFTYMEVDEREKISKKKYATVFAYYREVRFIRKIKA